MSNPVSSNSPEIGVTTTTYKRDWASGFRRLQVALAWWGVLILFGGWLHNSYSSRWGNEILLLVWLGITALGFIGSYLLAPAFISSGVAFMWGVAIALGFLVTLLVLYPLKGAPWPALSVTWHVAFALGYLLNGYFSDRRLWWVAGWEILMALLMLYVAYNPSPDPTNPLSIGAHPIFLGRFNFYYNQGLLLGLTTGIPLIIAALPFWKENYSRG